MKSTDNYRSNCFPSSFVTQLMSVINVSCQQIKFNPNFNYIDDGRLWNSIEIGWSNLDCDKVGIVHYIHKFIILYLSSKKSICKNIRKYYIIEKPLNGSIIVTAAATSNLVHENLCKFLRCILLHRGVEKYKQLLEVQKCLHKRCIWFCFPAGSNIYILSLVLSVPDVLSDIIYFSSIFSCSYTGFLCGVNHFSNSLLLRWGCFVINNSSYFILYSHGLFRINKGYCYK